MKPSEEVWKNTNGKSNFNVGLAYGDLSDAQEVDKTATEVLASKTRKYNRVTAIQGKLEECLNGFVTALAFYNGSYMSGVEFTCEFNDSILADEESERQQDRQDVSMGVMSLLEYRMKWYNEDEETAKAKTTRAESGDGVGCGMITKKRLPVRLQRGT